MYVMSRDFSHSDFADAITPRPLACCFRTLSILICVYYFYLKVFLEKKSADVEYDSHLVELSKIVETIEDAGFEAKSADEGWRNNIELINNQSTKSTKDTA